MLPPQARDVIYFFIIKNKNEYPIPNNTRVLLGKGCIFITRKKYNVRCLWLPHKFSYPLSVTKKLKKLIWIRVCPNFHFLPSFDFSVISL